MVRAIALKGSLFVVLVVAAGLAVPMTAVAAVAWSVHGVAEPSEFVPAEGDRYQLLVMNTGDTTSGEGSEGVRLVDRLPRGVQVQSFETEGPWECSQAEELPEEWVVRCVFPEALGPGKYASSLGMNISVPGESGVPLENRVTVSGGGATVAADTSEQTLVGMAPQQFGITDFDMESHDANGVPEVKAGGHPWQITTSLGFSWRLAPPNLNGEEMVQVENVKKISVELPAGLVGNLLNTERCSQQQLAAGGNCPEGSRVGSFAVAAGAFQTGGFRSTDNFSVSSVFNMVSEPGYPAELAIRYLQRSVYIYVSEVHTAHGERARLTTVGVPPSLETGNIVLTLWGRPGTFNGSGSSQAFITDPTDCSAAPAKARLEAESWGNPGHPVFAETTVFPEITGCSGLLAAFRPGIELNPLAGEAGTTQADSPSGFEGSATVPDTSGFEEAEVSEVRDVSVALPPGLSVSPAAAQGLVGCKERGAEGINLGTTEIGPGGVDEGNPEATEYGAGHAGGNGSPYDDAQYHTAPGHCPNASTIGSVEVFTPLLENRCGSEAKPCAPGESPAPLQGHVFIAQPKCGGDGQSACTGEDAEDGILFTGYVELSGDGVLIKEHATIAVSQTTGQMTLKLRELPEFPFNEIKVHVHGGSRAPLETPQACGPTTTSAVFTPWSSMNSTETFSPEPSVFNVDADGAGGTCPPAWPFSPGFTGGSVVTTAGAFTHFTTTLTRKDREQNPTQLSVTPPLGLLAMLSSVTPCSESQASTGDCPEASLVGHDTAGAGSGTEPFYVTGKVYLTGPYNGAPFGLDVVTPAVAGPFNLGNVVVRATINVNPSTAQVTITSAPIPQAKLGIPLRLKTLNVTIDRDRFVFNPTNCNQQQLTATLSGNEGATVAPSTPFAVANCAVLPFKPVLKVAAPGKASKRNGAGLAVTFTSTSGQAGIAKVKVDLPKQLPSRLATLQKACTDKVFNENPAGCPAGSVVGSAVLHTPVLKAPLRGPIYIVSHGGAAFPDLVIVLQGEGVTINLDGTTDIKHGITSEAFNAVPDAPFTSFTATFPQGPHSILATNLPAKAKFDLCGQKLNMPTRITGQNNAVINKTTKIAITGCKKPKPHKHPKAKKHK